MITIVIRTFVRAWRAIFRHRPNGGVSNAWLNDNERRECGIGQDGVTWRGDRAELSTFDGSWTRARKE